MATMRLQNIEPHPLLKGYIEKLWVFESMGRAPSGDMKLIVPNGCIKLVIPFRNGLSGTINNWYHLSKENSITLIGMTDVPSIVDVETNSPSGTIGIQFNPMGAYRFFQISQSEIKNQIHLLTDILGKTAKVLEEQISNQESINGKIILLQQFLLKQLMRRDGDDIFDFCIQKIAQTKGTILIKELERNTGFSSRWLNIKFLEKVGISPKNLSSIIRFQQFYRALTKSNESNFLKNDFYDYYYDQSHFIKDFKRFTGFSPTKFSLTENEFGKIFYKE
jgi:AraC-like DNA-binding protein